MWCRHIPSRSCLLPPSGRETARQKTTTTKKFCWRSCTDKIIYKKHIWYKTKRGIRTHKLTFDNVELLAHAKVFPAAILSVNSTFSFFIIILTICRRSKRASANFANFGPKKTNSTMLGFRDQLEDDDSL